MLNRTLLRSSGSVLLLDGVATLIFGHSYVRCGRIGIGGNRYNRAVSWVYGRPGLLLRAAGAVEAGLGIALLNIGPIQYESFYRTIAGTYNSLLDLLPCWIRPATNSLGWIR